MATFVALVAASLASHCAEPAPAKQVNDKKDAWKPGKITISKETTHITGPLRKDGYVDFIEALNRRASKGVTPQNNAAVMLLRAMGPSIIDKEVRKAYFKRLGIDPLPEKGDYYLDVDEYLKKARPRTWEDDADHFWDADITAWDEPWSAKQYPLIAGWLKANEKPLRLVAEAVRRPRYYSPVFVPKDEPWIGVSPFQVDYPRYRSLLYPLGARAMLRVKMGQVDRARDDAMTLHLIARRLGQGPSFIDYLVARALDSVAFHNDVLIAHHGGLSVKQAMRHSSELANLPKLSGVAKHVDIDLRYAFLDAVGVIARQGPKTLVEWTVDDEEEENKEVAIRLDRLSAITGIDWDHVLRRGNAWYDDLSVAANKPTRDERIKAVKRVLKRFDRLRTERKDVEVLSDKILDAKSRRQRLSEIMGDYLVGLWLPDYEFLYIDMDDRDRVTRRMALLAFALAAHRADNGAYPKTLSALTPKYIAKLPRDPFAGADFRYRRDGAGYVLYSVGSNGKDDGGFGQDHVLVHDGIVESDDRVISTPK